MHPCNYCGSSANDRYDLCFQCHMLLVDGYIEEAGMDVGCGHMLYRRVKPYRLNLESGEWE